MKKTAFITGVAGQDGSHLAELLISKGYTVHGLVRRPPSPFPKNLVSLEGNSALILHVGDMCDAGVLWRIIMETGPDEIYNLAAQSHVGASFHCPSTTADSTAMGALRVFEGARLLLRQKPVRVYQASTSELFGSSPPPQSEESPFQPRSPYACAKALAHWEAKVHREAYGMFISCGILFNHEGPRRGEAFVTRKVTKAVARIKLGLQESLELGNPEASRDWGFAGDYVEAMWRMLQVEKPGDYVIATGESKTVRQLVDTAFRAADLEQDGHLRWGDARFTRPTEVDALRGDASKARRELGWAPKVGFESLIRMMYEHDLKECWETAP